MLCFGIRIKNTQPFTAGSHTHKHSFPQDADILKEQQKVHEEGWAQSLINLIYFIKPIKHLCHPFMGNDFSSCNFQGSFIVYAFLLGRDTIISNIWGIRSRPRWLKWTVSRFRNLSWFSLTNVHQHFDKPLSKHSSSGYITDKFSFHVCSSSLSSGHFSGFCSLLIPD